MGAAIWFGAGLVAAGSVVALAWALVQSRLARARALLDERLRIESAQRAELAHGNTKLQDELNALVAERARLEERVAQQATTRQDIEQSFRALSAEALRANGEQFLQLAGASYERLHQTGVKDLESRQQSFESAIHPIRESLGRFDNRLTELEGARIALHTELSAQLRGLVQDHLPRLERETAMLSRALRQPSTRGRWGELQLRRVVEMAGMLDHCDFHEQPSAMAEDGRLRPDVIVRLPGGRHVVIDAKTPLASYLEALEQEDDVEQRAKLDQHARQVRAHMTALGRRGYWEQFEPTPEFVVMFVPGEAILGAALRSDPALLEHGAGERVIPATPTTLIALLRAVAYGWRQEEVSRNAEQVAELGRQLHRRIGRLADHWNVVGRRLEQTVKAYNSAAGSLESRVLVTARRLGELGAGAQGTSVNDVAQVAVGVRRVEASGSANVTAEEMIGEGA